MKELLLLLPVIFVFHDFEEIVGFGWFFRNNPWLYERFPKVMKSYVGFTELGMAAAVYEEFLLFGGVSLLAYFIQNNILYAIWFGMFAGLAGHFCIHIGHTLYIRKYIPSFITSVICLPISVIIMIRSAGYITFNATAIAGILISIIVMMGNLSFVHKLMHIVNEKISNV